MYPPLLMNLVAVAIIAAGVAYLLIRPVTRRFAARLEELIPEPGETRMSDDYGQLAEICHSLSQRMEEIEARQEFFEKLLPQARDASGNATAAK